MQLVGVTHTIFVFKYATFVFLNMKQDFIAR